MSEYQKKCVFCNTQIRMSDENGKWLPFNLSGTAHECKKNGQVEKVIPKQEPMKQKQDPRLERIIKQTQEIIKELEALKLQQLEVAK